MNTPTHLVINWSLARSSGQEYPLSAVLIGSVAPDIPLYLLSLGGAAYYGWWKGMPTGEVADKIWGELYFRDPWWMSLHNLLHSPLMLIAMLVMLWFALGRADFLSAGSWGGWLSWFFLSCLAHSLVDIPVHHNDGPLLFWPLNWQWRFNSPVSYWHPAYYGIPCMIFELGLLVWLTSRLAWPKVSAWLSMSNVT
jgi:hypothetical protein